MLFSPGWRASVRQDAILAIFSFGLVLGGTLSAGVVWLLSGLVEPVPSTWRMAAILVVAALGVLRELGLVTLPLPQNARQIPQDVLQRRLRLGALQFGFELGTGVRTYVSSSAPYVLAVALLLSHQGPLATLLTGTAFGVGRALIATLSYASRHDSWDTRRISRLPWLTKGAAVATLTALALLMSR